MLDMSPSVIVDIPPVVIPLPVDIAGVDTMPPLDASPSDMLVIPPVIISLDDIAGEDDVPACGVEEVPVSLDIILEVIIMLDWLDITELLACEDDEEEEDPPPPICDNNIAACNPALAELL